MQLGQVVLWGAGGRRVGKSQLRRVQQSTQSAVFQQLSLCMGAAEIDRATGAGESPGVGHSVCS